MEIFKGVVQIRLCNEGSRSEGHYAFLVTEECEWRLSRNGGLPFDDPYYTPFDGKSVAIEGESRDKYLIVANIAEEAVEEKANEAVSTEGEDENI